MVNRPAVSTAGLVYWTAQFTSYIYVNQKPLIMFITPTIGICQGIIGLPEPINIIVLN